MKNKNIKHINKIAAVFMLLFVTACSSSLVIQHVDYSQPLETVLHPNSKGVVNDVRQGLSFNVKPLQYAETKDTTSVTVSDIHVIRGTDGYYYVTAPGFKDVYIMAPAESKLETKKKVLVSQSGLTNPAFNQRKPYIELLDNGNVYNLTKDGLQGKQK